MQRHGGKELIGKIQRVEMDLTFSKNGRQGECGWSTARGRALREKAVGQPGGQCPTQGGLG